MDIASRTMDGNADAVEFCPHYPFQHVLAVATYTLEEGTQPNRSGSILLFSANSGVGLELLHHVETIGVFDLKWNPHGTALHPLLAQADAGGSLSLYRLQHGESASFHDWRHQLISHEDGICSFQSTFTVDLWTNRLWSTPCIGCQSGAL